MAYGTYGRRKVYRRGVRRVGSGGVKYSGYKRKATYSSPRKFFKTYRKRTTGPRGNPTKTMSSFKRTRKAFRRPSAKPRRSAASRSVLARTPGTYTISGQGQTLVTVSGEQGLVWGSSFADLNGGDDIASVIATAAQNAQFSGAPWNQTPEFDTVPNIRFYITSVSLSITVTNQSQNDVVVICYPWTQRYTGRVASFNWSGAVSGDGYEQHTETASAANNLLPYVYGATPFQYRSITQSCKISKPRSISLQGGQHHTFTIRHRKREYWSPQRYLGSLNTGADAGYAGVTKGMSFTVRGRPSNGVTNPLTDFGFSSGKCVFVASKTYEYESVLLPVHWRDTLTAEYAAAGGEHIILPQTGAITTPSNA